MTIPLTSSENQLLAKLMELHTDEITAILGKTGLDVDLALTSQESYSEKTRNGLTGREYKRHFAEFQKVIEQHILPVFRKYFLNRQLGGVSLNLMAIGYWGRLLETRKIVDLLALRLKKLERAFRRMTEYTLELVRLL